MPEPDNETPAALGYRMPAEWEPHRATWIAWPHNREDWPGKFGPIRWVYAEIVRHLSRVERVEILVQGAKEEAKARKILAKAGVNPAAVGFHRVRTDRVWTRDSGPSFVIKDGAVGDERLGLVHWKFNAWAKYDNHLADRKVPRALARILGARRWVPKAAVPGIPEPVRIVLEGGAIDVNGRGTVLTTEECLLSPIQARNPKLNRSDAEKFLADYLGAHHVIWLGRGIVGDDTHGHVDDLARFVAPDTVVIASEPDPSDENHEILRENRIRLEAAVDQDGKPLRVVELPMPAPVIFDGQRLPASYANFLIANGLVLVPTFNDPADREALGILASLFPDRHVVGIHAVDLVWGLGTIHCMTQQEPA
ncbi:agmatine deiminase family protein [Tundrisphaera sp. TA3]|uniref:agmatine deiminase family protein n=1 Tax=Tundrisphaera sp. TA3 TaxID=3435775 RepID=UPI003EB6B99D